MTPRQLPGHRAVRAERGDLVELLVAGRSQEQTVADFADCYARELPGLIWFVMSLGASAEAAADAA